MRTVQEIDLITRGNIYRSLEIAGSGLTALRRRMDAIASNIANAETTNVDGAGNPYLRQAVIMRSTASQTFQSALGEATTRLLRTNPGHLDSTPDYTRMDTTPLVEWVQQEIPNQLRNVIYDPSHPDADANGFVTMPDVNILEEMADLMIASRAFDANVTVIDAAKSMITKSLSI
jgi:flagellar basal-body rod protein FlgC